MNVTLLIDAIVRQTTVLIAQLATQAGTRATLAHTANQVFTDLVRELKEQGLGNKIIAEMFGVSLRTYHNRLARLSESGTVRGRSLWEALLEFVVERGTVTRSEILTRFKADEEVIVAGVLKDLVDSGLLFRSGRGDTATYKAASVEDLAASGPENEGERLAHLVWVAVSRFGPMTLEELRGHVPAQPSDLGDALERLEREGRVRRNPSAEGDQFASDHCVIPFSEPLGWEAAVFDHYQAVVTAIVTKLRHGRRQAVPGEHEGGSTYTFDIWRGHPHTDEVLAFLQNTRERAVALRKKVEAHGLGEVAEELRFRVIAYVGQTVVGNDDEEDT